MKILIKSFLRQRICLAKRVAWLYIGIIVAILIVWPYLDCFTAYISGFSSYYELIISLGLLLLLFRKNPMIYMDEASLHYLEGTKALRFMYITKYIYSFMVYVIGAAAITYVLTSPFDVELFVQLALLMNLCNVLNWKSYHEAIPIGVTAVWYIVMTIPFIMSLFELCVVASLVSLVLLLFIKNRINLEKYRRLMKLYSKNIVAFVLNDQVMLANIANEYVKEKHYPVGLKEKMLKHPLVAKSVVIDTLRRPALYWGIKILLFIVAVICWNEINIGWLSIALIPVLFGNLIASFIRDSAYEANKLVLKQSSGLTIPYSDWYIALSYSVAPSVLCVITLVGACVFCRLNVIACLCATVLNLIINVLWHKMVVSYSDKRKLIDVIGFSLSVASLMII